MARPARTDRDDQIEGGLRMWAAWCNSDVVVTENTASMQSRIMAAGPGVLLAGGTGCRLLVSDDEIEAAVEAAVCVLSVDDQLAADVLRLEYQAAMYPMLKRRGCRPASLLAVVRGGQRFRADLLGVGLWHYRMHLRKARIAVGHALDNFRESKR